MVVLEKRYSEKEETFWQKLTLPVEEKDRVVRGGYRWFRSPNVYAIEHYRRVEPVSSPHPATAA